MKTAFKLKSLALSMAVASSALMAVAPATTQAGELSYNASVSNMYLWRGINISNPSPVVSGGADYAFDTGFYVGTWAASEGKFDGSSEWDIYGGYGTTFGDFSVDLGYAAYLYPYANEDMFEFSGDGGSMLGDVILSAGYMDLSVAAYINAEGSGSGNNVYYTVDYPIGKFGLHAGFNTNDDSGKEYTEFNISYAATDNLTFTLSKAQGKGVKSIVADLTGKNGKEGENPQLQVTYALPI